MLKPPIEPMEAELAEHIPEEEGWQYEPKWDGFRCLLFRSGDEVFLQSKASQPLARYFPEVVSAAKRLKPRNWALDGELAVPLGPSFSFDQLHRAAQEIGNRFGPNWL
jgi:ATP-dependent DNA ligase